MEPKQKITYIFGAGASAYALPTNDKLIDDMKVVFEVVNRKYANYDKTIAFRKLSAENAFFVKELLDFNRISLSEYTRVLKSIYPTATFDNYCRNLYLNGMENDYLKAKRMLSLYFFLKEYIPFNRSDYSDVANSYGQTKYSHYSKFGHSYFKVVDPRYNDFLTKLRHHFSDTQSRYDFNIISWNYDSQFLLAQQQIGVDHFRVNENYISINGIYMIPNPDIVAICRSLRPDTLTISQEWIEINKTIRNIIENNDGIKFYWENNSELINKSVDMLLESNFIIVIGYSFPYYNTGFDSKWISEIMRRMHSGEFLRNRLLLQGSDSDFRNFIEFGYGTITFRDAINANQLVHHNSFSDFYVPRGLAYNL